MKAFDFLQYFFFLLLLVSLLLLALLLSSRFAFRFKQFLTASGVVSTLIMKLSNNHFRWGFFSGIRLKVAVMIGR